MCDKIIVKGICNNNLLSVFPNDPGCTDEYGTRYKTRENSTAQPGAKDIRINLRPSQQSFFNNKWYKKKKSDSVSEHLMTLSVTPSLR